MKTKIITYLATAALTITLLLSTHVTTFAKNSTNAKKNPKNEQKGDSIIKADIRRLDSTIIAYSHQPRLTQKQLDTITKLDNNKTSLVLILIASLVISFLSILLFIITILRLKRLEKKHSALIDKLNNKPKNDTTIQKSLQTDPKLQSEIDRILRKIGSIETAIAKHDPVKPPTNTPPAPQSIPTPRIKTLYAEAPGLGSNEFLSVIDKPKQGYTIFIFNINPNNSQHATFEVYEGAFEKVIEVRSYLEDVCEIILNPVNGKKVITEKKGEARLENGKWTLVSKAHITIQ